MNQTSQLNWEGEDLVFISCEDFWNYISCSSLDLIIVFALCHDEEVKGLGVCRGNPAHRSFPQDPWLASTAAVHWDQTQTFIFLSLQQASRQIKCTMCQYIGVRKRFGLFCLATPRSSIWQVEQCLRFAGEVKPLGCAGCWPASGVFICPSPASSWKDRMASLCWSRREIAVQQCDNMRPWEDMVCRCCSRRARA